MATETATKWVIDPAHSEVQFKAKHLVITTVTGSFKSFEGSATTLSDDFEDAEIHFSIDVDSLDTNQEQRDAHLKGADFFDAETHPKITFQSTSFKKVDDSEYELKGALTLRGVTKDITLKADFGGNVTDPWGQNKVGFELTGKVNRHDYGLNWNAATEAGGLVVGPEIRLSISVQLIKQA